MISQDWLNLGRCCMGYFGRYFGDGALAESRVETRRLAAYRTFLMGMLL